MSDINLSKAVRSNLLSLQNTATMMAKTQERLATGLKVNSAMDNPTNFFTASGLKSRAGDLGLLMDSVSNAVQTLSAADKGISAITKLVESAQATARQALQTAATISQAGEATAATVTAGAFTTVDVSDAGEAGEPATITAGAFTNVDLSGTVSATSAVLTGGEVGAVDLSGANTLTFTLEVDGTAQQFTLDAAAVSDWNTDNAGDQITANAVTAEGLAKLINAAAGADPDFVASVDDGALVFTAESTGEASTLQLTAVGGSQANNSGLATGDVTTGAEATGQSISFEIAINGAAAERVTINADAVTAYNDANDTEMDIEALTADDIVALINDQVGDDVASVDNNVIVFSANSNDADPVVTISNYASTATTGSTGIADATDTGEQGVAGDSISFSISVDGGTARNVRIDAAAVAAYNTENSTNFDPEALTAENVAAMINDQVGVDVASVNEDGNLVFESTTEGGTSGITITNAAQSTTEGSAGIANATATGTAAGEAVDVVNPKRAELVSQYNELLQQINDLAKDASFNGVNLLNGDELQVIFNEDGSSRLDVAGVTFDFEGLGLEELDADAFDTNAGINTILTDLKSGIETLRSQASKFGSNLQVVQTRQNFTKDMVNVLETGAANLTLADTNEEAANLLALQTRQQLASTALSMASQADQAVLRLF